jgi:subtilisin family serine protease
MFRDNIMHPLEQVKLKSLMELTSGKPDVVIGLIDGPVAMDLPTLMSENISSIGAEFSGACTIANSLACAHGTFVAGILSARRTSEAPAICPNCTLLVRPIFIEKMSENGQMPSANPQELAEAILDCVNAGASILNLSAALMNSATKGEHELEHALDYAARHGVILIAAAGNQGTVGSTIITRHPCVIPVAACNQQGYPLDYSNLGRSISKQGLSAPGEGIVSLDAKGNLLKLSGTSAAAPFVTGTIALLRSIFPNKTVAEMKSSLLRTNMMRRTTVIPLLLDAWTAYQNLAGMHVSGIRDAIIPAY